jgi:opacity protein-like surface antigen
MKGTVAGVMSHEIRSSRITDRIREELASTQRQPWSPAFTAGFFLGFPDIHREQKTMRASNRWNFLPIAALALLYIAQEAQAADLPTRRAAPIAPAPVFTWTGFYVGFNFGHTWTANPSIAAGTANLLDLSIERFGLASAIGASGIPGARLNGFFFGGQAGYNWQFADGLIASFEADIQGAGVRGGGRLANVTAAPIGFAVTSGKLNRSLEFLGTVRGRLGYAVTPTIMAYVTGGLAYGGANLTTTIVQSLTPSILIGNAGKGDLYENLVGWTIGAGGEMALSRNVSAKVEYLYYDLGSLSLSPASNPLAFTNPLLGLRLVDATNVSTRFNGHIVRAGLNYRFDWSIPETSGSPATPLFASPQFAATARPVIGDWSFKVVPYMWAINVNGGLTIRSQNLDANVTIIDAITKSSSFPLAFMGRVEASNGPYWLYGDFAWVQLRFSGSTLKLRSPFADVVLGLNADGHLRQTIAIDEAGVGYELARWKLTNAPASFTALDAYAGIRYVYLGSDLTMQTIGAVNSALLGVDQIGARADVKSGGTQWVDPVIGLRMRHSFSPGENFETRADIGGFGAGSKFSWQFYGGYSHDFEFYGLKLAGLVGYRALSLDYSKRLWDGKENGINAIIHGPVTGVSMRF